MYASEWTSLISSTIESESTIIESESDTTAAFDPSVVLLAPKKYQPPISANAIIPTTIGIIYFDLGDSSTSSRVSTTPSPDSSSTSTPSSFRRS